MILVLDIDGTLADLSAREHLIKDVKDPTEEDWLRFLDPKLVAQDKAIPKVRSILDTIIPAFDEVLFLTGRSDYLREVTVDWLDKHYGLRPDTHELFMRPTSDPRDSDAVKEDLIENFIFGEYGKNTEYVFIDDENVATLEKYGPVLTSPDCWDYIAKELKLPIKGSHQVFAALDVGTLERIYELTYKYGWLAAMERDEGWLPDRAYVEKAKIEGELEHVMPIALNEIATVYQWWLEFHTLDGWKKEILASTPDRLLLSLSEWNIPYWNAIVSDAIYESTSPEFQQENADALWDLQVGFFKGDHYTKILAALGPTIMKLATETDLLDKIYPSYLKQMGGLELEIARVQSAYERVTGAASADVGEQIIAFQVGITTAHHSGEMADYIIEGGTVGEAKKILDNLSSGPQTAQWNKDLEQVLGIKIGSASAVLSPDQIKPLHDVRNQEKHAELVARLKKDGWVGRPILVEESNGRYYAWSGTHRLAAATAAGIDVPVAFIDSDKVRTYLEENNYPMDVVQSALVDATIDDDDRYKLLLEAGDYTGASMMNEELLSNDSTWNKQWKAYQQLTAHFCKAVELAYGKND